MMFVASISRFITLLYVMAGPTSPSFETAHFLLETFVNQFLATIASFKVYQLYFACETSTGALFKRGRGIVAVQDRGIDPLA